MHNINKAPVCITGAPERRGGVRITVKLTGGGHATPRGERTRRGGRFKAHPDTVRCSAGLYGIYISIDESNLMSHK
jgi:hypothetical protein